MSNNNKMEGLDVGYYYLDKIGLMRKDDKKVLNKGVLNKGVDEGVVEDEGVEEGIVEDGVVDYNDSRELFGRKGIVDQHNCYAYAFLYSFIHNKHKPQPGEFAHTYSNKNTHKCYPYFKNIKNDNPHIYTTLKSHCKKPYYHIFYFRYLSFICFFNSIARFFLSINSYLVLLSSVSSIFLVILFIISCAFCNFCFISSALLLLNLFCLLKLLLFLF